MGEEAVALAKAVGYRSAGTVEYLVDKHQRHYFLEMNTRLQVEHPVTEMVTGLDLVELMIRVAAGEKLPISQEDAKPKGWAFECRVYAEDPLRGFLPSVGTLSTYRHPLQESVREAAAADAAAQGLGAEIIAETLEGVVRLDDGVREGGEISVHYDPMIAKLIAHAPSRESARLVTMHALDRYRVRGLRHNVNFLRTLLDHPRFAAGHVTTAFIPEEFPDGYDGHVLTALQKCDLLACGAALQVIADMRDNPESEATPELMVRLEGDGEVEQSVTVRFGEQRRVHVEAFTAAASADAATPSWTRSVELLGTGLGPGGVLEARLHGERQGAPLAVQVLDRHSLGWSVSAFGTTYGLLARSARAAELAQHMKPPPRSELDDALLSPMPGTLLSVSVEVGEAVVLGQELAIVEAMKMQNVLVATRDGVVRSLMAPPGSTLAADQPIIAFEAQASDEEAAEAA